MQETLESHMSSCSYMDDGRMIRPGQHHQSGPDCTANRLYPNQEFDQNRVGDVVLSKSALAVQRKNLKTKDPTFLQITMAVFSLTVQMKQSNLTEVESEEH